MDAKQLAKGSQAPHQKLGTTSGDRGRVCGDGTALHVDSDAEIGRHSHWRRLHLFLNAASSQSAFLKVYTQYVSRYKKAMVDFTNYKKCDPQVIEMLRVMDPLPVVSSSDYVVLMHLRRVLQLISEKTEVGGQDINSFFIRPIQRIPRYRLLLKDLLKRTEEDHNDFQALSTALKQVSDVAEFINEKANDAERIGKLLEVQSRLCGPFPVSQIAP